jgi:hypothetical protein
VASDLVASLQPWSIEDIWIGEEVFRVPAMTASQWLWILLEPSISVFSIVPGLLEPDAKEHVDELIITGCLSHEELEDLAWEIVSIAAGRPWWTVLYLLGNAKSVGNSDIVQGELALHSVDASSMSLASWLSAVYMIFARGMDQQKRQQFDMSLARPMPGLRIKTNPAANRAAFAALEASE